MTTTTPHTPQSLFGVNSNMPQKVEYFNVQSYLYRCELNNLDETQARELLREWLKNGLIKKHLTNDLTTVYKVK